MKDREGSRRLERREREEREEREMVRNLVVKKSGFLKIHPKMKLTFL